MTKSFSSMDLLAVARANAIPFDAFDVAVREYGCAILIPKPEEVETVRLDETSRQSYS